MKLFSSFHEKLLMADDSASTISTVSVSEHDVSDPSKGSSHLDDKSGQLRTEPGADYLSVIFSDSQLTRLYKFESEDSGVELPSGANSPSTQTGSEQSFMVHSRESSCNSCNMNSDPSTPPDGQVAYAQQSSEIQQEPDSEDNSLSPAVDPQDDVFLHSEELGSDGDVELHIEEDVDGDQCRASGISPDDDEETSGRLEENCSVTERTCLERDCDDITPNEFEPETIRRSDTSDSLEEYMDQCCRLSEAQQASSNPLGSGLGYLDHICQLIEKIGQLQESNLQLQRRICSLQKDGRMTKTKEGSPTKGNVEFKAVARHYVRRVFRNPGLRSVWGSEARTAFHLGKS
ncbi:hypothetical protein EYF80_034377 [Liparis tanakae]|uniref:DUF4657 domain-containing protein n=1 Tax=Liparis tanakae TaxID=230148 RepID=A0A4Z2GPE6_9TELE|nr:hypothetical protein EYF80_034377 [Liparis tanakae]